MNKKCVQRRIIWCGNREETVVNSAYNNQSKTHHFIKGASLEA